MPKQAQAKKTANSTPARRTNQTSKDRENEQDKRDARRALKEAHKKGVISWERVKREVGL